MSVTNREKIGELAPDQLEHVCGGAPALGIYRPSFRYKKESLRFFKTCVGDEAYTKAMNSEAGRTHHYVVARTLLNQTDWEKFVWIEEHGSLEDFPG